MWTPGPTELIIILVIVLIIFGAGKLPGIGKALGKGIKEFKEGASGHKESPEQKGQKPAEQGDQERTPE